MTGITSKGHGYRPDIDGLRALAILGVLVFHLDESWLTGGFLGVDVFFVISGYLITSIIRREIAEGRFSFGRFYERRVRRILPAFFATVIVTGIACSILLMPAELMAFGKSLRYALFSIGNIHFKEATQDYFNADASSFPLLHTWSLGVEEQFYIVLPPLLLLIHRWRKGANAFVTTLLVLFTVSIAACVWRARDDTAAAFFLLPYRAWQMVLGAFLTTGVAQRLATPALGRFFGPAGILLIVASYVFVSSSWYHPALSPLGACIGAAMIILGGAAETSPAFRLLASRPMVFVGLISYSLYLWHWPAIVLLRPMLGATAPVLIGLGLLSFVLAWASWRWIETPWRNPAFLRRSHLFCLAAALTLLLLGGASMLKKTKGLIQRFDSDVQEMVGYKTPDRRFNTNVKKHYDPAQSPYFGAPGRDRVIAIWGDSHADALMPWLHDQALARGESLRLFSVSAQAPVPGVTVSFGDNDSKRAGYTEAVLATILADAKIHTVVMHARWSFHLLGRNEDAVAQPIQYYGQPRQIEAERAQYFAARLRDTTDTLLAAGKRLVLVYPVPEAAQNVPDLLAKNLAKNTPLPSTITTEPFEHRQRHALAALDALPDHPLLVRIRPHEILLVEGRELLIQVGGKPLYSDDDHLSKFGLDYLAPRLKAIFPEDVK